MGAFGNLKLCIVVDTFYHRVFTDDLFMRRWLWRRLPSVQPGQPKFTFEEGQGASSVTSDGGSCTDTQATMVENISRQPHFIDRDSPCDDMHMLRALAGDDTHPALPACIPDGGSCTDLQFLENISHEFHPKPSAFSRMRYTRDGGSSSDLQSLGKLRSNPTFWSNDAHILCDDNTDDLVHVDTVNFLSEIPSVDMYQMKAPSDAGFTLEELSEMETSGSSDVTSLVVPKEEYDFSSFEEFSFDGSVTTECQSEELLENDTSFWNHMLGSSDQSTFPSVEELPAIRFSYPAGPFVTS